MLLKASFSELNNKKYPDLEFYKILYPRYKNLVSFANKNLVFFAISPPKFVVVLAAFSALKSLHLNQKDESCIILFNSNASILVPVT